MPRVYEYMNYTIQRFKDHYRIYDFFGNFFAEVDTIKEAKETINEYLNSK